MNDPRREHAGRWGCIADDVTGATDLASHLVSGGMRVLQWLDAPRTSSDEDRRVSDRTGGLAAMDLEGMGDVDAVVVALKIRSVAPDDAIRQSIDALGHLVAAGCDRFFFKYCSTFDSTPQGNIGPVSEALMDALGVEQTIFCPAFPRNGRTVYQGHLFVGHELLDQSPLRDHPLNPMTDANLPRWLQRQTKRRVGMLPYAVVALGKEAIADAFERLRRDRVALVVVDACDETHLESIARATEGWTLLTGGSAIASHFLASGGPAECEVPDSFATASPVDAVGGDWILSGSCSPATRRQIEAIKPRCRWLQVTVDEAIADCDAVLQRVLRWASDISEDYLPRMIFSTISPEELSVVQARHGAAEAARAIESLHGRIARALVDANHVRRLIVAGGETSGSVVAALGIRALRIGPPICPGVPWTRSLSEPSIALALKSGNFGDDSFFEAALEIPF